MDTAVLVAGALPPTTYTAEEPPEQEVFGLIIKYTSIKDPSEGAESYIKIKKSILRFHLFLYFPFLY